MSKAAAMDAGERSSVRQVTVAMRWMLYVAAFFVLCAGIQLFILTEDTDRFFAKVILVGGFRAFFLGSTRSYRGP